MKQLDVIWPLQRPPDVMESAYSYEFCRKTTRRLFDETDLFQLRGWHEWPDSDVLEMASQSEGGISSLGAIVHSDGLISTQGIDGFLWVTDPELVIAPIAVQRMMEKLDAGAEAVLSVFNETGSPLQLATLPAIYLNLSTYLEVAEMLAKSGKDAKETEGIDGEGRGGRSPIVLADHPATPVDAACVLVSRSCLEKMRPRLQAAVSLESPFSCLSQVLLEGVACVIDPSAFIHRFGAYGTGERQDLGDLVPDGAHRLLDVGCAQGGFGAMMRSRRPDLHITGVEMNRVLAEHARPHYHALHVDKIEDVKFDHLFDHINCGDLIEHLYDPWQMFQRLYALLHPGGTLVVSLPNAGHWSIVRDLAAGTFPYLPFGLLCITHIRWFTESSIREGLVSAGFKMDHLHREQVPPTPQGEAFINLLCESGSGDRTSLLTNQLTLRAVKI